MLRSPLHAIELYSLSYMQYLKKRIRWEEADAIVRWVRASYSTRYYDTILDIDLVVDPAKPCTDIFVGNASAY